MREFGIKEFKNTSYINFESSKNSKTIFDGDFEIKRFIAALQIESGVAIIPGETLIILYEIQEAPSPITALKYFQENALECPILAAGSLLGVATQSKVSFHVGKVQFLDLRPLN